MLTSGRLQQSSLGFEALDLFEIFRLGVPGDFKLGFELFCGNRFELRFCLGILSQILELGKLLLFLSGKATRLCFCGPQRVLADEDRCFNLFNAVEPSASAFSETQSPASSCFSRARSVQTWHSTIANVCQPRC